LPRHNERDVEDVPEEVRRDLELFFADTAEDVLAHALTSAEPTAAAEPAGDTQTGGKEPLRPPQHTATRPSPPAGQLLSSVSKWWHSPWSRMRKIFVRDARTRRS
ncbi:MAG TPA: S16 family serine protease, partial [Nannocystis sp.]